jgi:hypothetical protein
MTTLRVNIPIVDADVGRWAYHYQKMVNDWVDEPRDIYRDENYQSYTVL